MKTPRNMARRQLVLGGLGAAALATAPARALAADYPERPSRSSARGPRAARPTSRCASLCQIAARELGQPIAVENRAGASGMIGTKALASARPDGYTIGQIPISVTRFSQTRHGAARSD